MLDNLSVDENELYQLVSRYSNAFSELELLEFENSIFGDYSYKYRVISEFRRLKNSCRRDSRLYHENLKEIIDIERLLNISDFDQTVVPKIADRVVKAQVKISQPVRLYSSFPRIKHELENLSFIRKKSVGRSTRR